MGVNFIKKYKILIISKNKMSNRVDGLKTWVTAIKKLGYCINGWMNEWMSGIKLNYIGGPFSKMVRFLKFKFLIVLKLNYYGGQFKKK